MIYERKFLTFISFCDFKWPKMRVRDTNCVLLMCVLFVCGHVNDVEDSGHSFELTQSLNLGRQELIQEACAHFPPSYTLEDLHPTQLEHILVDDEHKLLYCYVPKVRLPRPTSFLG